MLIRLVYKEIGLLKHENQNQNFEIAMLKELVMGSIQNSDSLDKMDRHTNKNKRPVRLLPPSILYGDRNKTETQIHNKFYGPPTNCSELSLLGYTLNGYYQVKSGNMANIAQVHTVYCSFKQSDGKFHSSGSEDRRVLSHLESGLHFYATQENYNGKGNNDVLRFTDVKLNMGNGFDSKYGLFTAPKSGVYQFFFKGELKCKTDQFNDYIYLVHLLRNHSHYIVPSLAMTSAEKLRDPVIEAITELKQGNIVQVNTFLNKACSFLSLTFSGSLLQELH